MFADRSPDWAAGFPADTTDLTSAARSICDPALAALDSIRERAGAQLAVIREAFADLDRRAHELAALKAELDQRQAALAARAEEIERARASFDREVSDRRRLEQELRRLAETDDLTGHLNRRAFFRELQIVVSRSKRYGHPPTLLYIDIDRFKAINDTRGHAAGDAIIRTVLERIVTILRSSMDIVGRIGGDEFAILLPETTLSGAFVVADRIRLIVAETPFSILDQMIPVSLSIGIAAWNGVAGVDVSPEAVEDWVARADAALYQAKQNGRNAICSADDDGQDQSPIKPD